jgi:hypothetical protein
VIGTKLNSVQQVRNNSQSNRRSSASSLLNCRADEINLDCMDSKYLAPATTNSIKLAQFFDKTIQYKLTKEKKNIYRSTKMPSTSTTSSIDSRNLYHSD